MRTQTRQEKQKKTSHFKQRTHKKRKRKVYNSSLNNNRLRNIET